MTPNDVLDKAGKLIDERANYGDFEVTALRTASMQAILHEEIRTPEGWLLDMVVTKLARIHQDPKNLDHYLDSIAYLSQCAAFIATDGENLDSTTSR